MKPLLAKTTIAGMALALGSGLLASGSALADTVQNDLDATADASVEVLHLIEGEADGTVSFGITATNLDGIDGCNLDGDASLSLAVQSSDPTVATVAPASLDFETCADVQTVTISPEGAGTAEVTLSQTANTSTGFFNVSAASMLVIVAKADTDLPDTTPPVIEAHLSADANANGWHNSAVKVSWSVTDGESEITRMAGCDTTVVDEETTGATLTCSAKSEGGSASESVTIKLDTTAPKIAIDTPLQEATFTVGEVVKANFSATDDLSGVASVKGTVDVGELIDTSIEGKTTFSVTATDNAGNTAKLDASYMVVTDEDDEEENDDEEEGHDNGLGMHKAIVCHKGKTDLKIALPAVHAHLKHGDTLGSCTEQK